MDSLPMNELSRIYASAQDRTTKTHILQLLEKLRPTVKSTDRVLVLTLAKQVKLQDQDVFEDATVLEVAYSEKTDQLKILEGNISSKDNSVLLYRIFNIIFDEKWSASDLRILLRNFTLYSLKFSYSFKEKYTGTPEFYIGKVLERAIAASGRTDVLFALKQAITPSLTANPDFKPIASYLKEKGYINSETHYSTHNSGGLSILLVFFVVA